jgi:hypothetical protein
MIPPLSLIRSFSLRCYTCGGQDAKKRRLPAGAGQHKFPSDDDEENIPDGLIRWPKRTALRSDELTGMYQTTTQTQFSFVDVLLSMKIE